MYQWIDRSYIRKCDLFEDGYWKQDLNLVGELKVLVTTKLKESYQLLLLQSNRIMLKDLWELANTSKENKEKSVVVFFIHSINCPD